MAIQSCDICDATIDYTHRVVVGESLAGVELCYVCAEPVVAFLAEHNLLKAARLSHLQKKEEQV